MSEMPDELRRAVAGKRPPPDVRRQILEGALARVHAPRRPAFLWPALAAASAAALALVIVPMLRSPTLPAPGSVRGEGVVALGPHQITVNAGGRVVLTATDPGAAEIAVDRGAASFKVHHLDRGQSFRVRTSEALVEVVGTRFTVDEQGGCTRVAVDEGKVRVTPASGEPVLLVPPQQQRFCGPEALAMELLSKALPLESSGDLAGAGALLEEALAHHPGGVLEGETLFHLWVVHSRVGDEAGALRYGRELLEREPTGPRADRVREWLPGR